MSISIFFSWFLFHFINFQASSCLGGNREAKSISSFIQSPTSDCMLPLADRKLYAEHKLMGGGVPSPEGLQLNRIQWGPLCY